MFRLYATGEYSLGALSEEMAKRGLKTKRGKFLSPERIKSILQNKFYIGKMVMWNEEVKGKHKPLIDESLFNQVQNIFQERKITQDRRQKREFLLRGLVYCQTCKRRLTAEVHPRGEYYRCQSSINNKCKERYIPTKLLESQIETLYSLMEPSTNARAPNDKEGMLKPCIPSPRPTKAEEELVKLGYREQKRKRDIVTEGCWIEVGEKNIGIPPPWHLSCMLLYGYYGAHGVLKV